MNYIEQNFHKWTPVLRKYNNGRIAVEYMGVDEEFGYPECCCIASINLPEEQLEDGEIVVKAYSENEGLYEMMLAANHIGPEIRKVYSGFISAPVVKLLLK